MAVGEEEEGKKGEEEEGAGIKEGKEVEEETNGESGDTKTKEKSKTRRISKSLRGRERRSSSRSSIVSEASAYSSNGNNNNNSNNGARAVEASPRSTLDYESRRSSTSSYYSDHYYYYSPLSSAPPNCSQDFSASCNSPTYSVDSYSTNRSLSSKAKSWLSLGSFNSTSCQPSISRAPSKNFLRNFFSNSSSSSSSSPLSLRQEHSMWLDFSHKKKGGGGKGEKERSTTPPSNFNSNVTEQSDKNSMGKLRRCSSDRNRLAMLDPTCSALDQLFPLKTSRSSRFSRQLDVDPSLLFDTPAPVFDTTTTTTTTTTQLDLEKGQTSNFGGDPLAPLLARNATPNSSSSLVPCAAFSTPPVAALKKKVRSSSEEGGGNNGHDSGNESGKSVPFLQRNASKASSYCSSDQSSTSVPTPKISRVLLNMAEAHEEQHLKSLWHKRGSSCLPKCASAILSRSKHSEHHARFPFSDD